MSKNQNEVEQLAHKDAKALRDQNPANHESAVNKLREDALSVHRQGLSAEQKFWDTLAKDTKGLNLPDLKLEMGTDKHVKAVKDATGKSLFDSGERAQPGQLSPGLEKGQGPYQAFRAQGMNDHDAKEAAHKVKQQTGRSEFRQGEQFKINQDGSVTSRLESRNHDGSYTETTSKDGKVVSTTAVDKDGKRTNTTLDKDGKTIEVSDKNGNQVSTMRENNDGSLMGKVTNADGSVTNISQPDKDHRTETTTKDGKTISEKKHEKNADGSSTDTLTDDSGVHTTKIGSDGKKIAEINEKDGVKTGWESQADGSVKIYKPDGTVELRPSPAATR